MNDMETNNVTQWVIIGAAVIVLIVGGAWLAMRGRATAPATVDDTTTTAATTAAKTVESTNNTPKGTVTASSDGESVVVENQTAGETVKLSALTLTRASWVAVRDDMSILGAAWFPSSATSGSVELQRATVAGKSYRVVMYVDDGDKKFDYKTDQLITANGGPVGVSFDAQ
jgi:hypothetical protein